MSTGTLLDEDLIDAFATALDDGALSPEQKKLVAEAEAFLEGDDDDADPSELVNALQDALNDAAPPYGYFGAHGGDGADFGFWVSWESIDEAVHDGQLLKVNDLADVPKGYSGDVLEVNDHGNATLYTATRGRLREVWAVV